MSKPKMSPPTGIIVLNFSLGSTFANHGLSISPFLTRRDLKYRCPPGSIPVAFVVGVSADVRGVVRKDSLVLNACCCSLKLAAEDTGWDWLGVSGAEAIGVAKGLTPSGMGFPQRSYLGT